VGQRVPAANVVEQARHADDHRSDQDDETENDKHQTLPKIMSSTLPIRRAYPFR
jgi:hypothetical protein